MGRAAKELFDSGRAERATNVGDIAPRFTLPNATGDTVTLKDLLHDGPVVLSFYRGSWCPYLSGALWLAALDGWLLYGAVLLAIVGSGDPGVAVLCVLVGLAAVAVIGTCALGLLLGRRRATRWLWPAAGVGTVSRCSATWSRCWPHPPPMGPSRTPRPVRK